MDRERYHKRANELVSELNTAKEVGALETTVLEIWMKQIELIFNRIKLVIYISV